MKCQVKSRGKFFIVVDPFNHKSFTLNNKLNAEALRNLLNELYSEVNSQSIVIAGYQERNEELFKENQQIKHIVKDAYNTERTQLGKSVLRQLSEQIGVEVV